MKQATIALVLCAIPAMAGGQTVTCDECTHEVSYYKGSGGLVATAADGAEMVTYLAACGGVHRSGQLTPRAGQVAMLFSGDLACETEDGKFEIGPVEDGGWFWITDAKNSAVGSLVDKGVLDNPKTDPTDAGAGVRMSKGTGAVFLKETDTGRVGILPTILPQPPATELPLCGLRYNANKVAYQLLDDCQINATFTMKVTTQNARGQTVEVEGGVIQRNAVGDLRLTAKMLVSGHISYRLAAGVVDPEWGAIDSKPLIATWGVYVKDAPPGSSLASIGVAQDTTNFNEFIISPAAYCNNPAERDHEPEIYFSAGRVQNFIIPEMPLTTPPTFINRYFTIECPPPAAQQGTELVPDNPFPPEVD